MNAKKTRETREKTRENAKFYSKSIGMNGACGKYYSGNEQLYPLKTFSPKQIIYANFK